MNREQLKTELKRYKKMGLTDISLRKSEYELRGEYLRIITNIYKEQWNVHKQS